MICPLSCRVLAIDDLRDWRLGLRTSNVLLAEHLWNSRMEKHS